MARSGSGISAIFASTSLSPSALPARGPRRAATFSSWARSFIAARSSSVNPLDFLSIAVVLLADFWVPFIAVSSSASLLPEWLGGSDLDCASEARRRNPSRQFDCGVDGVRFEDEVARDRSHAVNARTFARSGLPVLHAHGGCLLWQPKRQPGSDAGGVVYRVVVRVDRLLFVLR